MSFALYQVVEVGGSHERQLAYGDLVVAKQTVEDLCFKQGKSPRTHFLVFEYTYVTPISSSGANDVTDAITDIVRKECLGKYSTIKSGDVHNALVFQSGAIREAIRSSGDAEELAAAVKLLEFAEPLWKSLQYGYKFEELNKFVRSHAEDLIAEEEAFLSKERKNSRVRVSTEKNVAALKTIAGLTHI